MFSSSLGTSPQGWRRTWRCWVLLRFWPRSFRWEVECLGRALLDKTARDCWALRFRQTKLQWAARFWAFIVYLRFFWLPKVIIIEGSWEVKLPTIGTDEKQRWEESEKRREEKKIEEERRSTKRKSQKREDPGARKSRKVAKHCVFSNDLWLWRVEK